MGVVGPVIAAAMVAAIADGKAFRNGRELGRYPAQELLASNPDFRREFLKYCGLDLPKAVHAKAKDMKFH